MIGFIQPIVSVNDLKLFNLTINYPIKKKQHQEINEDYSVFYGKMIPPVRKKQDI